MFFNPWSGQRLGPTLYHADRTSRQGSCNHSVDCLQWLGSRAIGPTKWSGLKGVKNFSQGYESIYVSRSTKN